MPSHWAAVSNTRHPLKSLWAKPVRGARLRRRLRVVTLSPNCAVAMGAAPGGRDLNHTNRTREGQHGHYHI